MYKKKVLPNGLRILYEKMPGVRSASLGLWAATGSRFENATASGASHFIEHMLFKGTSTRSSEGLAQEMDEIGGHINAFTTKESTCFHGRVLDTHLDMFADMLYDMFTDSRFDETDMDNERGVIFEEMDMYRDTPDDLVSEKLMNAVYRGSSLARPILGSKRSLKSFTGEWLRSYKDTKYTAGAIVITLAGSFTKANIDHIASLFSSIERGALEKAPSAHYRPAFTAHRKAIEQNHIILGFPSLSIDDDRRFTMQIMNSILGGGMSSRLFQSLREKQGLCYSVCSYPSAYIDAGLFSVYTALGSEMEDRAIAALYDELMRIKDDGVTQSELDRSLEQFKSSLLMGMESTSARMNRLGASELALGTVLPLEAVIERYSAVTREDILALAREVFDFEKLSVSVVGKCRSADTYRELFNR